MHEPALDAVVCQLRQERERQAFLAMIVAASEMFDAYVVHDIAA
jgi:hypothetical protein